MSHGSIEYYVRTRMNYPGHRRHWEYVSLPNDLRVSRRLTALANATEVEAGTVSKTQKSYDLARRKAVGYMPVLGRPNCSSMAL